MTVPVPASKIASSPRSRFTTQTVALGISSCRFPYGSRPCRFPSGLVRAAAGSIDHELGRGYGSAGIGSDAAERADRGDKDEP